MATSHKLSSLRRRELVTCLLEGRFWGNCFLCGKSVYSVLLLRDRFQNVIEIGESLVSWKDEGFVWEGYKVSLHHLIPNKRDKQRNFRRTIRICCVPCNKSIG